MGPPTRSRDLTVSAGVLSSLETYPARLTFWVAAPNTTPEERWTISRSLYDSLALLHLAGQPLQCSRAKIFAPSQTPQHWRVCVDVYAAAGQADAVLELLDLETATVRLPGHVYPPLRRPVRLALDDRNLVRLQTTGWPVGYECRHIKQALEEDVQLPVRVMDVQPIWHKTHPNLRFQGEFMVTAFMPSRHPTTEWVLRDAAGSLRARAPVRVSSLPVEREGQWARRVPASLSPPVQPPVTAAATATAPHAPPLQPTAVSAAATALAGLAPVQPAAPVGPSSSAPPTYAAAVRTPQSASLTPAPTRTGGKGSKGGKGKGREGRGGAGGPHPQPKPQQPPGPVQRLWQQHQHKQQSQQQQPTPSSPTASPDVTMAEAPAPPSQLPFSGARLRPPQPVQRSHGPPQQPGMSRPQSPSAPDIVMAEATALQQPEAPPPPVAPEWGGALSQHLSDNLDLPTPLAGAIRAAFLSLPSSSFNGALAEVPADTAASLTPAMLEWVRSQLPAEYTGDSYGEELPPQPYA